MNGGSLFSGIGGFDIALRDCGVNVIWQVEIDKSCQSILKKQFPGTEIFSDVKSVGKQNLASVDIICGGFPCQDLSVAGRREGLAGERSGLWFEFARIIEELRPGWVVIENVPGLLSSNTGRDFAVIIRWLAERGYGVAWRVLDTQYFGLAQRRKRVFVVGHLGDGRAAEVLFEREGGCWNPAPRREKGKGITHDIASSITNSGRGTERVGESRGQDTVIAFSAKDNGRDAGDIAPPLFETRGHTAIAFGGNNTSGEIDTATAVNAAPTRRYDFESETFVAMGFSNVSDGSSVRNADDKADPLTGRHGDPGMVAYNIQHNDGGEHKRKDRLNGGLYVNETDTALAVGTTDITAIAWQNRQQSGEIREQGDTLPAVSRQWGTGGNNVPFIGVRRLTPTECERLQGFPDGWTDGQSDSARYRQLGNAVAVPVVRWIIDRIVRLEAIG